MIFKRNMYNRYLPLCEADIEYQEISDEIQWLDLEDTSKRKYGFEGLKERITDAVNSIKNKALNSMGMKDGFSIKACITKLKNLLGSFLDRVKNTVQNWTPLIRDFVNKICDLIQDAIDYVKEECS